MSKIFFIPQTFTFSGTDESRQTIVHERILSSIHIRGDIFVSYRPYFSQNVDVKFDTIVAQRYAREVKELMKNDELRVTQAG
jgi:hypothetical protein